MSLLAEGDGLAGALGTTASNNDGILAAVLVEDGAGQLDDLDTLLVGQVHGLTVGTLDDEVDVGLGQTGKVSLDGVPVDGLILVEEDDGGDVDAAGRDVGSHCDDELSLRKKVGWCRRGVKKEKKKKRRREKKRRMGTWQCNCFCFLSRLPLWTNAS